MVAKKNQKTTTFLSKKVDKKTISLVFDSPIFSGLRIYFDFFNFSNGSFTPLNLNIKVLFILVVLIRKLQNLHEVVFLLLLTLSACCVGDKKVRKNKDLFTLIKVLILFAIFLKFFTIIRRLSCVANERRCFFVGIN